MNTPIVRFAIALVGSLPFLSIAQMTFQLDNRGLTSLKYGSWEFVTQNVWSGDLELWGVQLKRDNGSTYDGDKEPNSHTVDQTAATVNLTFDWGTLSCHYDRASDNRLNFKVTAQNSGNETVTLLKIKLVIFTTPSDKPDCILAASSYINCNDAVHRLAEYPMWINTAHGPGAMLIDLGAPGILCMGNDNDPAENIYFGVPYKYNAENVFPLMAYFDEPIKPGDSGSCAVSWRFGDGDLSYTTLQNMASDIYMKFAGAFPFHAKWNDRRIIGRTFNAGMIIEGGTTHNPRQWFNGSAGIDIRTTDGLEKFRTAMLGRARDLVNTMEYTNAQGVITWDIEGQQYGSITYGGDPEMIDSLAPEMVYKGEHELCVIDEYFKIIRDAGRIPGICIRPQKIVRNNQGDWTQIDLDDPGEEIYQDVKYAYTRWGCRLFYMDSNGHPTLGSPIPAARCIKKAMDAYPDILIAGEWQATAYYGFSPTYDQWWSDDHITITPANVRLVYPGAFTLLLPQEGQQPQFVEAAKAGDILLAEMWYRPPSTEETRQTVIDIGKRPMVSLTGPLEGTLVKPSSGVVLEASVSDEDGSVTKVEFYSGGVKLGEDSNAPFTYEWVNAPEGKHNLCAKVFDNSGASAVSAAVNIVISENAPMTGERLNPGRTTRIKMMTQSTISWFRLDGSRIANPAGTAGISTSGLGNSPSSIVIRRIEGAVTSTRKVMAGF
jgi:hypothetical protein